MTLLGEYGFNERSGLISRDSSGNSRHLAASNASTSWDTADDRYASAARSQHTGLPGSNASLTDWTMMAWVKRTGTWTNWAAAFGKNGCIVEFNAAASYSANFFGGTNSNALGANLALDTWTHYAVTRTAAGSIFYVNAVATGAAIANAAQNFGTAGPWGVALTAATSGDDSDFVGSVRDFRTLDTALSPAEIAEQMNARVYGASRSLREVAWNRWWYGGWSWPQPLRSVPDLASTPTVDVTPGAISFSGVDTVVQPVVSVTPGAMALTGAAAAVQPVADLTPGNLTLQGVASGARPERDLTPGAMALSGVAGEVQPVVTVTPGVLALSGAAASVQPAVGLVPGVLTFAGVPVFVPGIDVTPGVLSFQGVKPVEPDLPAVTVLASAGLASLQNFSTAAVTSDARNLLCILVGRGTGSGTGAVTSVTDPAGNTWQVATRGAVSGGANTREEIWYTKQDVRALTAEAITVNTATTANNTYVVFEVTRVDKDNPVLAASADLAGGAASTAHSTPGIATTQTKALIVSAINHPYDASADAFAQNSVLASVASQALTQRTSLGVYGVTSTGTFDGDWTIPASAAAGYITVAFRGVGQITPGVLSFSGAAAAVQKDLIVTPGALALSGAGVTVQRVVLTTPGVLNFSGVASGARPERNISPGTIAFSGVSASVVLSLLVTPGTLSFQGVTLGVGSSTTLDLTPGALGFSGVAGAVQPIRIITPGAMSFGGVPLAVQPKILIAPGAMGFQGVGASVQPRILLVPGMIAFSGVEVTLSGFTVILLDLKASLQEQVWDARLGARVWKATLSAEVLRAMLGDDLFDALLAEEVLKARLGS